MRALFLLCLLLPCAFAQAQQRRMELPEIVYIPPSTDDYVWEKVAQVKKRIIFYNTIACSDSVVYSFGGFDTLRVQREMNRLEGKRLLQEPIHYPGRGFMSNVFFIRDSSLYLGGGHDSGASRYAWNDFWRYNLNTHSWTRLADLPFHYVHPPSVFLSGERVIVLVARLLGKNFEEAVPVLYEYDRSSDSWKVISTDLTISDMQLPASVQHISSSLQPIAFKVEDDIYVLCQNGCSFREQCGNTFFRFSLKSHEWTRLSSFPGRIKTFAFALADDGYGFIGGGIGKRYGNSREVFRYDPQKEKWEQISSLPRGLRYGRGWRYKGESYVGFGINDKFNTAIVWKLRRKR